MKPTIYTGLKVHNEIALCAVIDLEVKKRIEKEFLNNRISYCEKWENPGFFRKIFGGRPECTICINEMQREKAEEVLRSMQVEDQVELICKPVDKTYF
ncbi:MAG: hypothetical protein K2K87_03580 [Lachnospiraceae bacterium]|nr:hypothetical protein [Lachnospiraceae bacterium]